MHSRLTKLQKLWLRRQLARHRADAIAIKPTLQPALSITPHLLSLLAVAREARHTSSIKIQSRYGRQRLET